MFRVYLKYPNWSCNSKTIKRPMSEFFTKITAGVCKKSIDSDKIMNLLA